MTDETPRLSNGAPGLEIETLGDLAAAFVTAGQHDHVIVLNMESAAIIAAAGILAWQDEVHRVCDERGLDPWSLKAGLLIDLGAGLLFDPLANVVISAPAEAFTDPDDLAA